MSYQLPKAREPMATDPTEGEILGIKDQAVARAILERFPSLVVAFNARYDAAEELERLYWEDKNFQFTGDDGVPPEWMRQRAQQCNKKLTATLVTALAKDLGLLGGA